MDSSTVLLIIAAVAAIALFFKILKAPIKLAFKLLLNMLSGFVLLFVFNYISAFFDFSLGINAVNGLICGVLGIPGLVLLVLVQLFI